jgi:hypothetical protein
MINSSVIIGVTVYVMVLVIAAVTIAIIERNSNKRNDV